MYTITRQLSNFVERKISFLSLFLQGNIPYFQSIVPVLFCFAYSILDYRYLDLHKCLIMCSKSTQSSLHEPRFDLRKIKQASICLCLDSALAKKKPNMNCAVFSEFRGIYSYSKRQINTKLKVENYLILNYVVQSLPRPN